MKFAKHTPKKLSFAICTPALKLFFWAPYGYESRPSYPPPVPSASPGYSLGPIGVVIIIGMHYTCSIFGKYKDLLCNTKMQKMKCNLFEDPSKMQKINHVQHPNSKCNINI